VSFLDDNGYPGFKTAQGGLVSFNVMSFIAQQVLAGVATSMLVQVKSVTPGAGLLPGVVSVQPMVNQIGGDGAPVAHGTIYNIPFFRLQGGKRAIIADPEVGDIGLAVFASRDISVVKSTKKVGNPGSRRRFDMADGLYFGGFLNGTPTDYVQFPTAGGINLVDRFGNKIVTDAAGITWTDLTGNIIKTSAAGVRITDAVVGDTVGPNSHTHAQPNDSHGDTEAETIKPTAGT